MTTTDVDAAEGAPKCIGVHPFVFVSDVERSVGFFRDRLGFTVDCLFGKPPFYGRVRRDDAEIALRRIDTTLVDRDLLKREQLLSALVVVDGLRTLFEAFEAAGLTFHERYCRAPWGGDFFVVVDPDGNLIAFAEEVPVRGRPPARLAAG